MIGTLRRLLAVCIPLLAWMCLAGPASACPFCSMQGQTLTGEVNQASMVLYGTLTNAKPGSNDIEGTTDLVIETVIKADKSADKILGNNKKITLPRYVPTDPKSKAKFLIFCDVFQGKIDPYRGITVS